MVKITRYFSGVALAAGLLIPAVAISEHHEEKSQAGGAAAEHRSETAVERSNAQWQDDAKRGKDWAEEMLEKGKEKVGKGEEKAEKRNEMAEEGKEKAEKRNEMAEEGKEKAEKRNEMAEKRKEMVEKRNEMAEKRKEMVEKRKEMVEEGKASGKKNRDQATGEDHDDDGGPAAKAEKKGKTDLAGEGSKKQPEDRGKSFWQRWFGFGGDDNEEEEASD